MAYRGMMPAPGGQDGWRTFRVEGEMSMRALVADPGSDPALKLADVPEPTAGPGQILIEMEASSLNRGEVRNAAKAEPGKIIGWDVVGKVLALGDGVTGVNVGERVVSLNPAGGAWAERVVVPAEWTAPLPAGADAVAAATLPVAGITAVNILRLPRTHAGDRVLITGAAGGVGQFAVQLAVAEKARVTGQVSSEERGRVVSELGAEVLVHPGDDSPIEGEYDVVIDGIGGPIFSSLVKATALRGRMVIFGASAPGDSLFNVSDFYPKALTLYGFRVFQSVSPEQGVRDLSMLAEQVASGQLRTQVQATAPLSDGLGLVRDLMDRKVTGKVVLTAG
jgi:NADPH:quinone reductase-like Zn-dependent oxidoreductase